MPGVTTPLSIIFAVLWEHVGLLSLWCCWRILSLLWLLSSFLSCYILVLDGEIVLLEVRIVLLKGAANVVTLWHVHWWCEIWLSGKVILRMCIVSILFRIICVLIGSTCAFRLDVLKNWDNDMYLHFNFFRCIFWFL